MRRAVIHASITFLVIASAFTPAKSIETVANAIWLYLDPGHGGGDPGKTTPIAGFFEKEINLDVALRLHTLCAWEHVMSRDTDRSVDRIARAYQANNLNAFSLVSVHHNAAQVTGPQYTTALWETLYPHPEGGDATPQKTASGILPLFLQRR